jgi:hypothetical protein
MNPDQAHPRKETSNSPSTIITTTTIITAGGIITTIITASNGAQPHQSSNGIPWDPVFLSFIFVGRYF